MPLYRKTHAPYEEKRMYGVEGNIFSDILCRYLTRTSESYVLHFYGSLLELNVYFMTKIN
jgi:hypothetical protein